jgi:threonyl-tRNA synthetase
VKLDDSNDKLGAKIRRGELDKVPYLLVVGQKEAEAGAVSVRSRSKGDEGVIPSTEFVERVAKEVAERTLSFRKQ